MENIFLYRYLQAQSGTDEYIFIHMDLFVMDVSCYMYCLANSIE